MALTDLNQHYVGAIGWSFATRPSFAWNVAHLLSSSSARRCSSPPSQGAAPSAEDLAGSPREMYPAVCAECGKAATLPFRLRNDRRVYCSDCFFNGVRSDSYVATANGCSNPQKRSQDEGPAQVGVPDFFRTPSDALKSVQAALDQDLKRQVVAVLVRVD
jgi:CxxC-x17-CxxC domain-containing protein